MVKQRNGCGNDLWCKIVGGKSRGEGGSVGSHVVGRKIRGRRVTPDVAIGVLVRINYGKVGEASERRRNITMFLLVQEQECQRRRFRAHIFRGWWRYGVEEAMDWRR